MVNPSLMPLLVVDDDAVSRMALAGLLKRLPGVEVVEAVDGQEALDLLTQGLRPAICCIDVHMPRLDGLGLLKRLKAHPVLSHIPVIVVTGEPDRQTVQGVREQGVAGFFVKPFTAADARAAVERILRETQLARAEAPAATRARLNLDAATLGNMLDLLRQDIERTRAEVAEGRPAPQREAHASRLAGACKTVGLAHAATLFGVIRGAQVATADVLVVFDEVLSLVNAQQRSASMPSAEIRRAA